MLAQCMPLSVAEALRRQAHDCLRVAQASSDAAVKNELVAAAAWLHEEAVKIEKLVAGPRGGGGPGSGTAGETGKRRRAGRGPRPTPRYQLPLTGSKPAALRNRSSPGADLGAVPGCSQSGRSPARVRSARNADHGTVLPYAHGSPLHNPLRRRRHPGSPKHGAIAGRQGLSSARR